MTPIPRFEVEFNKHGQIFDPAQVEAMAAALPQLTDLLVFCHGWNNDLADARELSERFLQKAQEVIEGGIVPEVNGRVFGAPILLWPSKKFTEEELIPAGGVASAGGEPDTTPVARILEELKNDPVRLGEQDVPTVREQVLSRAQALLPQLESSAEARREYVFQLRSLITPAEAHADDGSEEFFTRDPQEIFDEMSASVAAPLGPSPGGSASLRENAGGAAGLRDLFDGVVGAARRIANFTTYYQMKERAGLVGRTGVNQLLRRLRQRKPDIRLHLIGHSFGARVVTAAADALDAGTSAVTLTLLQAAYSHNGLAKKFDERHDGFFRKIVSEKRASGPIIITHTKNDTAVGIAYPLASRLSHTKAAAFGDENDPYGGLGRNGAQFTPEAEGLAQPLADLTEEQPGPYTFAQGHIYNLKADKFISDHSDICKHEVAYAMLKAVAQV